jgi:predicted N-formylglutamate amidohydrolase
MSDKISIIITCEHGGNQIPSEYYYLFNSNDNVLETHRSYDLGALEIAMHIAEQLKCPIVYETISRLVIDQNRSAGNKGLWSEWSQSLLLEQKQKTFELIYKPYHDKVIALISNNLGNQKDTLHFSIHSFTPVLNGILRNNDIGLLYDPSRAVEKEASDLLTCFILKKIPGIKVRKNYPYKGISDGLTKEMRKKYGDSYCGIEIELNQRHFLEQTAIWNMFYEELPECIAALTEKLFQ